jgi:hypothetical protein
MIGYALGNVMNMGVTLPCTEASAAPRRAVRVSGSPQQYGGVTDITDARCSVARGLVGDRTRRTQPGVQHRQRRRLPVAADVDRVAEGLGVAAAPYPGSPNPLDGRMDHADEVWAKLVQQHGLQPYKATELASWWHTDADLGRQVETFADMSKSRSLGFLDFQTPPGRSLTSSTPSERGRSSRP